MVYVRHYQRYFAPVVLHDSLESFHASPVRPGIQVIPCGELLLELMVVDRQAATTIVVFHAAASMEAELPIFVGQRLTDDLDANVIFVSDPLLGRATTIGWFTGSPQLKLQEELVHILRHIQEGFENAQHLCFFGPSAGGFAALYFSHQFPGSLAVAANPQTDIANYHSDKVQTFLQSSWDGLPLAEIEAVSNLIPLYKASFPNYVAYLQCENDTLHLEQHARPWAEATKEHAERRAFIVDDWGEGHAPPPLFLSRGLLDYAIALNGDWPTLLADELFTPTLPD